MYHFCWSILACLVIAAVRLAFPDKAVQKPLSNAEQNAIAAYDDLEPEWQEKAVAAWKVAYFRPKKNPKSNARFLKNQPRYFPFAFVHGKDGNAVLNRDSWGVLGEGVPGVDVLKVVNDRKAICELDQEVFAVEGADVTSADEGSLHVFEGIFHVDGKQVYQPPIGESKVIYVLRPIPQRRK